MAYQRRRNPIGVRSRSKPLQVSKSSLLMAFLSCVTLLYIAGCSWRDAENRNFNIAVQNWDADLYVKVDDNIGLDLEGLIENS